MTNIRDMSYAVFSWPTLQITPGSRNFAGSSIWVYSKYWRNYVETHYHLENNKWDPNVVYI